MTTDELKLVTSLAGDKSWSPVWPDDPYLVKETLGPIETNDDEERLPLYFGVEEITMFLRHFCYWNDLCPKYNELRHWLPILSQGHVKLCDLTPEAWGRIIATQTIKTLSQ